MKLTYSINKEFAVELDGETLHSDYDIYRRYYPHLTDDEILKNIYNGYNEQFYSAGMVSIAISYDLPHTLVATLNLTEDQFIALAREELGLKR